MQILVKVLGGGHALPVPLGSLRIIGLTVTVELHGGSTSGKKNSQSKLVVMRGLMDSGPWRRTCAQLRVMTAKTSDDAKRSESVRNFFVDIKPQKQQQTRYESGYPHTHCFCVCRPTEGRNTLTLTYHC